MDYKKIIKNRKSREAILRVLRFLPDKLMISIQYRMKTGRPLNLKKPERYTEKIQWYKLYCRDPKMVRCVDKYDVREYIREAGYEKLLNECYGVFEKVEDIEYNALPQQFVIKDTLGGGGDRVVLCKNKDELDWSQVLEKMRDWIKEPLVKFGGREWPYYSGKRHRIVIEKFLPSDQYGLVDYKFMAFNGRVEFCYILTERNLGVSVKEGICDREMNLLPYSEVGDDIPEFLPRPDNYNEMLEIADNLARDFPHVRVDLYNVNGRIVFGEMTFFDSSGYACYNPDEFDYILGKNFQLPAGKRG